MSSSRKLIFWTLGLLMAAAGLAHAADTATATASQPAAAATPASGPTPYPNPNNAKDWPGKGAIRLFGWMVENRQGFWMERERKQGSVVFAGDSLIGGWGNMAKDLPDLKVANRGIGGEVTRGLLFRFKEDVLDLHPQAIVLLTGSNDLSAQQDPKESRSNILAMIDQAQQVSPGVPIVLCTIPPRDHAQAPVDPAKIAELNKLITAIGKERKNVAVLDLYTLLVDANGKPTPEFFAKDKLHMSGVGYKRVRDALVPVLKQFNIG